ncbi:MAG: hypothetical protein EXS08_00980 [Planctomycetes bacterium]|nr:hypothetical protein [Planctomycetota bacterium]
MSRPRAGRAGAFALGAIVGFLLLGYAVLRLLDLSPRAGPQPLDAATLEPAPPALGAWGARVTLGAAEVVVRLLPLHDEPALEEFRARALRQRYDLPAGSPWRLYLTLASADAAPLELGHARVRGTVGGLEPFADLARAAEGNTDPVRALLAAPVGLLAPGTTRPLVLWGALLGDAPEIELTSGALRASAPLALEAPAEVPRWFASEPLPTAPAEPHSLADEVAALRAELEHEKARRLEREEAFREFSRVLAQLPAGKALGLTPAAVASAPPPTPDELAQREAEAAARARAEELGLKLSVLMRLEGLRGLDLLESGALHASASAPAFIGPVVFRVLDERGLLAGSVRAERLRLEGSAAAHTLTLVLEDGFESRGGERVPFTGGARRITLSDVDPEPWMRDCPELFSGDDIVGAKDDGRWSLAAVRRELNRVLGLDTRLGWYRLHSLGGVRGAELMDVQLEELGASGRVERRLFADRLHVALEDDSVVLELFDGALVRGGDKTPFRDGQFRVVLPGVDLGAWRAAALPGLSAPPERTPAPEKPAEPKSGER